MFPATLSPLFVGTLLLIAPQPSDVQVINAADDTVNAASNDDTPTASDAESQLSGTLSQAESKLEQISWTPMCRNPMNLKNSVSK